MIKPEVGHKYKTRNGQVADIVSTFPVGRIAKAVVRMEVRIYTWDFMDLEDPEFDIVGEIPNALTSKTTSKNSD